MQKKQYCRRDDVPSRVAAQLPQDSEINRPSHAPSIISAGILSSSGGYILLEILPAGRKAWHHQYFVAINKTPCRIDVHIWH